MCVGVVTTNIHPSPAFVLIYNKPPWKSFSGEALLFTSRQKRCKLSIILYSIPISIMSRKTTDIVEYCLH